MGRYSEEKVWGEDGWLSEDWYDSDSWGYLREDYTLWDPYVLGYDGPEIAWRPSRTNC